MFEALTRIGLPVMEEREVWKGIFAPVATGGTIYKEVGDKITKKELTDAGQTDDDIKEMIKHKSIKEAS